METIKASGIVQVSIGGRVCAPVEHYDGRITEADRKSPVVPIDAKLCPIGMTAAEFVAYKRKQLAEIMKTLADPLAGGQDWITCNGRFPSGIPEEPAHLWEVKLRSGGVMPMVDFWANENHLYEHLGADDDIVAIRKVAQPEKADQIIYASIAEVYASIAEVYVTPMLDGSSCAEISPQKQMREALDGWGALVEGKKEMPLVAWNGDWESLK